MKRYALLMVVLAFASGCATAVSTDVQPAVSDFGTKYETPKPNVYRGEIWTWDEKEGWVTLRQGGQDVRILVDDPRQLKSLQLHAMGTFTGTPAPQTIDTVLVPAGPGVFVPVGTALEGTMNGRVVSVDPKGIVRFQGDRGVSELWIAEQSTYSVGDMVIVETTIRPVQFRADPSPSVQPSAGISSGPGDYATITGRILSRNSDGRLTVDSPRGPIQVWVAPADVDRFKVGDYVQIRSRIRTAG